MWEEIYRSEGSDNSQGNETSNKGSLFGDLPLHTPRIPSDIGMLNQSSLMMGNVGMFQQTQPMFDNTGMFAQSQPMMGMQLGYPSHQFGYDCMTMPRYSRGQIIQGLRDYVIFCSKQTIMREEKLDETPNLLRHACAEAKVSQLGINYFQIPEMGLQVPFYFCKACGKLFYPRDIMM